MVGVKALQCANCKHDFVVSKRTGTGNCPECRWYFYGGPEVLWRPPRTEQEERVDAALYESWDPIGGNVPIDEYSSYVPLVMQIVESVVSREEGFNTRELAIAEVAAFLSWASVHQIGIDDPPYLPNSCAAMGAIAVVDVMLPRSTIKVGDPVTVLVDGKPVHGELLSLDFVSANGLRLPIDTNASGT